MKALIQRVHHAVVCVDGRQVGAIEQGVLAYIGLAGDDSVQSAQKMIDKILNYRIFENPNDPDKQGKLDCSVRDVQGGLLLVSQFTLMAKTDKGRRPDFTAAMPPEPASQLFAELLSYAHHVYPKVQAGEFGANMQVVSCNDGPINLLLQVGTG